MEIVLGPGGGGGEAEKALERLGAESQGTTPFTSSSSYRTSLNSSVTFRTKVRLPTYVRRFRELVVNARYGRPPSWRKGKASGKLEVVR